MKYIKRYKDIDINESKNYGDLYHVTMFVYLVLIIDSNKLESSNINDDENREEMKYKNKYKNFVSFTRDKKFIDISHKHLRDGGKSALCVDAEKLSHRYKMVPYSYYRAEVGLSDFEAEESLLLPSGKNLENIKSYIKYLIIPSFEKFNKEMENYRSHGSDSDWFYDGIEEILGKDYSKSMYYNIDRMEEFYNDLLNYIKETKIPYEIH